MKESSSRFGFSILNEEEDEEEASWDGLLSFGLSDDDYKKKDIHTKLKFATR